MYEPEKILVQNAGIDPGVAALLQNANKGNMDPAALMAMMNNGVNQLRPCPVPAYLTCNPFGCNGGFTGYGYGYNDGCGCGC